MITKKQVKTEQIKRKQTCSVSFVKVFQVACRVWVAY